jgi:hypothetical protein
MNQREKDFIELINDTPAMGMLPLWPYEEEPGQAVNNALLDWIAKTHTKRMLWWMLAGFGMGMVFMTIIIATLEQIK